MRGRKGDDSIQIALIDKEMPGGGRKTVNPEGAAEGRILRKEEGGESHRKGGYEKVLSNMPSKKNYCQNGSQGKGGEGEWQKQIERRSDERRRGEKGEKESGSQLKKGLLGEWGA